jgi:squalene-hopene/tetraprenyl-beta-curcumene cyclase
MDFLSNAKPGKSNESLIVALLVAHQFRKAERAGNLLKELLSRQNPGGGWGWLQGGDSDALATGQALYALMQSGLSADHSAIRRARDYLIESQTEDGSWLVPSRAISAATDEARLKKLAPIYRYWGTAWATIGLSETLPKPIAEPPQR